MTWDESVSDYIAVDPGNTTFGPADTFTRDLCQHYALLNKLYGYTYDTAGCTAGTVAPVAFDFWPLADTINGGQVLLRYGEDCEQTSGGSCYLVTVSNAGMLHIFDSATGNETQAVIPPQFFRPNAAANNQLSQLMNQPSLDLTRRYYFDGGLALYHDDVDGNGYINVVDGTPEPAYLIAGFGRGGAAYIKWDVSTLMGGQLSRLRNPPHPLFVDRRSGLQHLRDTWATPWVGNHQLPDGRVRPVAIFPSGHQAELDAPAAPFAELGPGRAPPSGDTETSPYSVGCADLGISADECAMPSVRDVCLALAGVPASTCATLAGSSYDRPGLAGFDPAPLARYGITSLSPLRISVGPFSYSEVIPAGTGGCGETVVRGQAYRINFSRMNLQTGDSLIVYDANGAEVRRFTGTPTGDLTSGWIRSPSFRLRLVTDGVDSGPGDGYAISGIDVIRDMSSNPTCNLTRPGIYAMDLEEWNGEPAGFAAIPGPGEARQAAGIIARFTSDCTDSTIGSDETCVDAQTSPDTRDLRYMTCPISADPAVYTEGGLVRGIYFGDECGQVWALRRSADGASWTARRLLSSNETTGAGFVIPGRASRHYRKIFSQVDLVASTCTGRRGIGVYFGTGNLQRPASIPSSPPVPTDQPRNLEDSQVTRTSGMANSFESDIMGVVWDTPDVPAGGYGLGDLANVTMVREIDPTAGAAQAGFFQELAEDEKILRAPLVFDGVAFFQSYQPTRAATECDDAVGRSRTYAFDNCTALPVRTNSPVGLRPDRTIAENPDSFIGGGLRAVVPEPGRDTGPMILSGDARAGDRADLQSSMDEEPQGGVRLLMWRTNVR